MTRGRFAPFLPSAVVNLLKPLSADIKWVEARTKPLDNSADIVWMQLIHLEVTLRSLIQ